MRTTAQSTNIADELRQKLLKKALAVIGKRQFLFKNMNLYSVGQLSKIIQQVTQQQVLNAKQTTLPQSDDFVANQLDNMMSMSDIKLREPNTAETNVTPRYSSIKQNSTLQKQNLSTPKNNWMSIIDLLDDESTSKEYITCFSIDKQTKQEQAKQIQIFREIKQRQYEQLAIKQAEQKKKKPEILVNLNNQRVMFGYDSKIVKLQRIKERQYQNLSNLTSNLVDSSFDEEQTKKKHYKLVSAKTPIIINNKLNVTLKQAQQQKQKQKKALKNHKRAGYSTQNQMPQNNIKVDPESHKQLQQAIKIKQNGIKIWIQEKQYNFDRQNSKPKANRRLTRSQYLQIKSNQQINQIFRQSKISLNKEQSKNDVRFKTDYDVQKKFKQQKAKRQRCLVNSFLNDSKDKSKIQTYSIQGKADLLKQVKDKPYLFSTLDDQPNEKKQSLSSIDKYNLLYIKFNGNPPKQAQKRLIEELQSQSKILKEDRPSLLSQFSNKKTSIKRQNWLIKRNT